MPIYANSAQFTPVLHLFTEFHNVYQFLPILSNSTQLISEDRVGVNQIRNTAPPPTFSCPSLAHDLFALMIFLLSCKLAVGGLQNRRTFLIKFTYLLISQYIIDSFAFQILPIDISINKVTVPQMLSYMTDNTLNDGIL